MTFATNVICTVLVAYRIWYINRKQLVASRNRRLRPLMLLIVESGAIYSATLLVLLILYNADSWFQYVILDSVSSYYAFFFCFLRTLSGCTDTNFALSRSITLY